MNIADDFAKRFEAFPSQTMSVTAVIALLRQVELTTRADEALAIAEALMSVGMQDAASLVHKHSKALLVEMETLKNVMQDELRSIKG